MDVETIVKETSWGRSAEINEIAAALAKAQRAIKGAIKDSTNPHFRTNYADLESTWEACREQLGANGIAVIQMPDHVGDEVGVTTLLAHASGQWIWSRLAALPAKHDAQGTGAVITYLRRYGLSSMAGVAPRDDDDGNAAAHDGPPRHMAQAEPAYPPARQPAKAAGTPVEEWLRLIQQCETREALEMLGAKIAAAKLAKAPRDAVARAYGVKAKAFDATNGQSVLAAGGGPSGQSVPVCDVCNRAGAHDVHCPNRPGAPDDTQVREPGSDDL